MVQSRVFRALLFLSIVVLAIPIFAQQTGALHGRVLASDGSALPGVTVEASSNVLPQPRVTTTDTQGQYRLPALIPGTYNITFSLSGMQTLTRKTDVLLGQDQAVDVKLGVAAVSENITVTAQATLVNKESTAIQSGISQQEIRALPLVQNYSDLQKLVPGVQYSQDTVRGPSAGSSGQDNVYMFDGANITMPLFGVLLAQPNINDIAQVNITRGAASAIDFNRAGGFLIDSVSKSGTNQFTGQALYELQNPNWVASQAGTQNLNYQNKQSWVDVNLGGPVVRDRLFFYGSYYRPYARRGNPANLYGPLPNYNDTRNEEFGKLTFTPTQSWLLDGSYRYGHEIQAAKLAFTTRTAPTAGTGYESKTRIGNLEGSKIISPKSYATFKLTSFAQPGFGRADNLASVTPSTALGTQIDINNLAQIGQLSVPLDRHAGPAFRLSARTVVRGPEPHLQRMGLDQHPGRSRRRGHLPGLRVRRGDTGLLRGDVRRAGRRRSPHHSLRVPLAEHRVQRRRALAELVVQPRRPRQPGQAVWPGSEERRQLRRFRQLARHEVPDARLRLEGHDPAAPRRHVGVQRQRHRLRQLRAVQPRGKLRCARRLLGPRSRAVGQRLFRSERKTDRRRPGRLVVR